MSVQGRSVDPPSFIVGLGSGILEKAKLFASLVARTSRKDQISDTGLLGPVVMFLRHEGLRIVQKQDRQASEKRGASKTSSSDADC